jgi:hypothetical protein
MTNKTLRRTTVVTAVVLTVLFLAGPGAHADVVVVAAAKTLPQVIQSITAWLVGLIAAIATLCLTIGGIRYLFAGGDPGEVAKAKDTLKYAAIGYGVAALAPVLVTVLKGFVGV